MKFKVPLAIGIVAALGAALWMRQIASWRPHVVARLSVKQGYMVLSRDGRRMLVRGFGKSIMSGSRAVVLDLASESIDFNPQPIRRFWKANAIERHLSLNKSHTQLVFTPERGQPVLLAGQIAPQSFDFDASGAGASQFKWFKARSEIYREGYNDLRIWDTRTGKLKTQIHDWRGVLSPDGLSSLRFTLSPGGVNALIRYHVPSGKFAALIARRKTAFGDYGSGECGWSPDGKFIWFVRQDLRGDYLDFNVVRVADSKPMWSAPCAGPSKWLPDGRIGIMQQGGFSWRDASGREIGRASGPLPGTKAILFGAAEWEASPDGRWIYDMDNSGTIRRWRAK